MGIAQIYGHRAFDLVCRRALRYDCLVSIGGALYEIPLLPSPYRRGPRARIGFSGDSCPGPVQAPRRSSDEEELYRILPKLFIGRRSANSYLENERRASNLVDRECDF